MVRAVGIEPTTPWLTPNSQAHKAFTESERFSVKALCSTTELSYIESLNVLADVAVCMIER